MSDMRSAVIRELRASRAAPPGKAGPGKFRRALYRAAILQFEELLGAAGTVSPASRPLLLFYALSQAGRAIVAAHGESAEVVGHGLQEDRAVLPVTDVLRWQVRRNPRPGDAFGTVARATGSGEITGSVALGAIWAATPATHRLPADGWGEDWRTALLVHGEKEEPPGYITARLLSMSGPPERNGPEGVDLSFRRYPTLPNDAAKKLQWTDGFSEEGNWIVDVAWRTSGQSNGVEAVAPAAGFDDQRWLIPLLPGESQLLSPLMSWWVLLYGLSMVARYHPALWAHSLAVDESTRAVPLESLLEQAVEVLPELVHQPLCATPYPIPEHLRAKSRRDQAHAEPEEP